MSILFLILLASTFVEDACVKSMASKELGDASLSKIDTIVEEALFGQYLVHATRNSVEEFYLLDASLYFFGCSISTLQRVKQPDGTSSNI